MNNEGWTWLWGTHKWHYFRNGNSLCRNWKLDENAILQQGNDDSPDNCAYCRNRKMAQNRRKERLK